MAWQKKQLAEDEKSSDAKKADARAVWYLSQRDHAAEELYQKLCRFFTAPAAAAAMASMVECGYLDDARYARNKANSLLYAHKSRREITQKLQQKGVDRAVITQTLDEIYRPDAAFGDTATTTPYVEQTDAQNWQIQGDATLSCQTQGTAGNLAQSAQTAALCHAQEWQDPELNAASELIARRYTRKLELGRQDLVVAALTRRGFSYRIIRTALAQVACAEG